MIIEIDGGIVEPFNAQGFYNFCVSYETGEMGVIGYRHISQGRYVADFTVSYWIVPGTAA